MLAHGGDRNLCQKELGQAILLRPGTAEDQSREPLKSSSHFLCLSRDTAAKLFRPFAVHEIVPMIEEEQTCLIQMIPYPGRCMQDCP